MTKTIKEDIEEIELDESGKTISDKIVPLTKKYRLKYDRLKNKWIEELVTNKTETSKNFGQTRWVRMTGYFPTYEWLLSDFTIKKTARAELKTAHAIIEEIAKNERLVSEFAKTIGKELDAKVRKDG